MSQHLFHLDKRKSGWIGISLFLLYTFYYDLFDVFNLNYPIMAVSVFFVLYSLKGESGLSIKRDHFLYMCGWIVFMVFFFLIRNRWIEHRYMWRNIRLFWSFLIIFCILQSEDRIRGIFHRMVIIGYPVILSTLYFYFNKDAYSQMINIWGKDPGGTNGNITRGYKAGLFNNYSHNATMITIVLLMLIAVLLFYSLNKNNSGIGRWFFLLVLIFIALFALILTAKRGHFLFCTISVLFAVLICHINQPPVRIIIPIAILALGIGAYLYVASIFPDINLLQERLGNSGDDYSSTIRLEMWRTAVRIFRDHPLFGIGWGGFRYATSYGIEAHNVYFNMLAETGITGLSIYLATNIYLLIKSIRNTLYLTKTRAGHMAYASICALLIQFFYLLYSITGNCVYDATFDFYAIAIGTIYICSCQVREKYINAVI